MAKAFRFGAVAGTTAQGAGHWRDQVRRIADLGFSTVLVPDGMQLLSPFAALAVAAEVSDLRVGTFVLAGPLRPARLAAWEARTLSVLTEGRFEMGIGTGRPEVREAAEAMGLPFGSPAERLQQVSDTIDALRELEAPGSDGSGSDGSGRTPVMVAAGGPKALALAAGRADIVTLAVPALTPRAQVAAAAARVRQLAGERADRVELSMNIFVVGDRVDPWVQQFIGADARTLIEHDSLTMLRGTPEDMAAELERRRAETGVSYVTVNAAAIEAFAPVIPLLTGR